MMNILYSPNFGNHKTTYEFDEDLIKVKIDNKTAVFDFKNLPDGKLELVDEEGNNTIKTDLPLQPISKATKENGVLNVVLLNYIPHDAPEEELFPEWKEHTDFQQTQDIEPDEEVEFTWTSFEDVERKETERRMQEEQSKEIQKQAETVVKFLQHELDRLIEKEELTEEQKNEFLDLYDPFEVGKPYKAGDKVRMEGVVYEVIQEHTSQSDWLPAAVPALFRVHLQRSTTDDDGEEVEVIHEWVQPSGGHDAYHTGDKVKFNGNVYESSVDNNVWSPDVHGWTEVEGG